ncbi:uncharacterized protein LOC110241383 [Exaiptasia diaphana]|uniref:Uncharacterized protein n=1 Tax=Exaiptasia diaphana TaxID=2652724 RepID=A0A913XDR0_EXADI|nr:uncharacterized protein LOC110241383 [Exaiptasia diaphana]
MKYFLVIALLVVLSFVVIDGKDVAKANKRRFRGTVYPKRFDRIKLFGEWRNCDHYHKIDQAGNGCGCVFIGCTGSRDCVSPNMVCGLTHSEVRNDDIKEGDCKCQWLDKENGTPSVTSR